MKSFRSTNKIRSTKSLRSNKNGRSSARYRSRRRPASGPRSPKSTGPLRTPGYIFNKIRQHSGLSVSSDPSERHRAKIRQSMLNWTRPEYVKEFEPNDTEDEDEDGEPELPPRLPPPNRQKSFNRDDFDEESCLSGESSDEEIVEELNEENIPPKVVTKGDRSDLDSDPGKARRSSRLSRTSKASKARDVWMDFDDDDTIEKGAKVLRKLKALPEKKIRRLEENAFFNSQLKKYKDAEIGEEDDMVTTTQVEREDKPLKTLKPGDPGFDDCKSIVLRLHNNKTPHATIRTILQNMGVEPEGFLAMVSSKAEKNQWFRFKSRIQGKTMYHNMSTGERTDKLPEGVDDVPMLAIPLKVVNATEETIKYCWLEYYSKLHKKYFYVNVATEEARWQPPFKIILKYDRVANRYYHYDKETQKESEYL